MSDIAVCVSKTASNLGNVKRKCLTDRAGAFIVLLVCAICFTPESLLYKLTTHVPVGGHLFYRHCVTLVPLTLYWVICEKKDMLWRGGWITLFLAALFACAHLVFPVALLYTAAGSATGILATNTVLGSILFLIVYKEFPPLRLIIAQLICLVGVVLIFVADREGSGTIGNLIAFGMAVIAAVFMIGLVHMMEKTPDANIIAVVYIAAIIVIAVSPALGFNLSPSAVRPIDWLYMTLGGAVAQPALYTSFVYPLKFLHPAEVAVVLLSEVVLGPLWVYLGVGEVPKTLALVGMGIVFISLLFNAIGAFVLEKWETEQAQKWREYRDKRWPPKPKKVAVEEKETEEGVVVETGLQVVTAVDTKETDVPIEKITEKITEKIEKEV
eukprot:Platyproteum_vivax@DN585_c0_g1_i1.p1